MVLPGILATGSTKRPELKRVMLKHGVEHL